MATIINSKLFSAKLKLNSKNLWGVYSIVILLAFYGICQFIGWFPLSHKVKITGSFDNPAGFVAVLSMGFPIGLFLISKTKTIKRYLAFIGSIVIALVIVLSHSRTGLLALITSMLIFPLSQKKTTNYLLNLKYYRILFICIAVFFIIGASILYKQKKDSANGRLLIWKVSLEMIGDKPLRGHGYGKFQANYMVYQAKYFEKNPKSKFSQLADNTKHPFNEFLKIAVEFGVMGLIFLILLIILTLKLLMKWHNEKKVLVLSGLASFMVFASLSYPLHYISIWLLLAFYFSVFLPSKELKIKKAPILIFLRSVIVIICISSLFYIFRLSQKEIEWKTIAENSLKGNTIKMLPRYEKLYSTSLKRNPYFLYNYAAELNVANEFENSIRLLNECQKKFNDYDVQMLLADNYLQLGDTIMAVQTYKYAGNMIPCRFLPLYQIFDIYKASNKYEQAIEYATIIVKKEVKIPSVTVSAIKFKAQEFIDNYKLQ